MDKKKQVAEEALKFVSKGNVVGLGSGTTASEFIKLLGKSNLKNHIVGVATSLESENLARTSGIRTVDIDSVDWIDITIDGADEIDEEFNVLKGGGGALTREKKVCRKSKKYIIVVSDDKLVKRIPERMGIPVEIMHFGYKTTIKEIEKLGTKGHLREDFLTNNGNLIVDFTPLTQLDLRQIDKQMKMVTGVIDTGLFLDINKIVLVSDGNKVQQF